MSVTGRRLACTGGGNGRAVLLSFLSIPSFFWECTVGQFPANWHISLLPVVLNPLKFMPCNLSNAIDNLIL